MHYKIWYLGAIAGFGLKLLHDVARGIELGRQRFDLHRLSGAFGIQKPQTGGLQESGHTQKRIVVVNARVDDSDGLVLRERELGAVPRTAWLWSVDERSAADIVIGCHDQRRTGDRG